jgi:hypothetical protein
LQSQIHPQVIRFGLGTRKKISFEFKVCRHRHRARALHPTTAGEMMLKHRKALRPVIGPPVLATGQRGRNALSGRRQTQMSRPDNDAVQFPGQQPNPIIF